MPQRPARLLAVELLGSEPSRTDAARLVFCVATLNAPVGQLSRAGACCTHAPLPLTPTACPDKADRTAVLSVYSVGPTPSDIHTLQVTRCHLALQAGNAVAAAASLALTSLRLQAPGSDDHHDGAFQAARQRPHRPAAAIVPAGHAAAWRRHAAGPHAAPGPAQSAGLLGQRLARHLDCGHHARRAVPRAHCGAGP